MDRSRFPTGRILAAVTLAVACVGQAVAGTAGVIQFVAGDVRIILAEGSERPAAKGSPVDVGDTITTAKASMAQIKMGDGAIVVVQPESRVTIAEYRYAGAEDGTERVRFRLEQGGVRALTGAIGHTHKANYSIETPIAHIGVRGTDHETYYFPVSRAGKTDVPSGVYNKVNVGLTFIRTEGGEVEVAPNQVGYAASARDLPKLLTTIPEFFSRSVAPTARRPNDGRQVATGQSKVWVQPPLQAVTTTSGLSLTAGSSTGSSGSVEAYTAPQGNSGVSVGHSGVNLGISPNGATLANTGSDPSFGVNWGSWQGGLATVNGVATTGSTHFASSTMLTTPSQLSSLPPSVATATYSYTAGPAPTNQLGQQGTINSLSVGVNFSTQQITNYSLSASAGGANWTANGSGTISQFTGASGIGLSGKLNGSSTAQGTANGAFVGSAAEKMITSFGLKAANQAICGVGYLSR